MIKKLTLLLGAAIALSACNKSGLVDSELLLDENQILFELNESQTKVLGNSFEDGDQIYVLSYGSDGVKRGGAYYEYNSSNSLFEPTAIGLGYQEASEKLTFYATYPGKTATSFFHNASSLQSSAANYEASDLLVATTSAVGDIKPKLTFEHKMSSLVVNVAGSFSAPVVNLKTSVNCNLVANTYVAADNLVAITPNVIGAQFKAVVAPQSVASGATLATLTTGAGSVSLVTTTAVNMKSQSQYVLDCNLSSGVVTCNGKTIGKIVGGSVTEPDDVNTPYNFAILPEERIDKSGDYHYAYHFAANGSGKRVFNFAACYSEDYTCPVWVAGVLHRSYSQGSGDRRNNYKDDPQIPCRQVETLGSPYNRGHMIASSDRLGSQEMNNQAFYLSNIAPQIINYFNTGGGVWNNYEDWIQSEYESRSDTMYVVNGCYWANTNTKRDGVTVPTHYYKAALRLKQANSSKSVKDATRAELECVAFLLPHVSSKSKPSSSHMITIDKLEEMTGENFFANIPNAPEDTYSASDWL